MSVNNNEEEPLSPLVEIWMCPLIEREVISNGKKVWRCIHPECKKEEEHFNGQNATKALSHVLGLKGYSITACTGKISQAKLNQYRELHERRSFAKIDQKRKRK